jgi:hypothetical protein
VILAAALSADAGRALTTPMMLDEAQSHTLTHGQDGGHVTGELATTRWFVVDGGGRVHPLRERYRQRVEGVVFFPTR